jgi:hypothetical protein
MKKLTLFITGVLAVGSLFAQTNDDNAVVIPCSSFHLTRPLSEIAAENPVDENAIHEKEESEDRENRKPQKFRYSVADGSQYGNDPNSIQDHMGDVPCKAPITNWAGQTASGFRPFDPSGAVGPNHYVQAINSTTFKVYNKTTGAAMLTASVGSLWSPATANDGDPIVMYDKAADRWFISQFGSAGNNIYIAISQTNNPTGAYYTYTFTSPAFPDYLKFGVWQDGYYMTSNQAQKVFCFERAAMLAGTPGARSIYKTFSPPQGSGFFVPMPGDAADGALPAAGTPCPIFSYSDNGWGAGFSDAVNIYKMAVTWAATPTATITSAGTVPTAAFDGTYSASWDDCPQPGTTQKLDGIGGVIMYRAQWKTWSGYNSVVLNWAVKISATQRSIKWCELRQNQSTGVWSMYQEGIYTPDTDTRWMGGICMDNNGAIALVYIKSNSTSIYPGLYYTGRRPCDPLGTLPITETVAIAGTGSQTGGVNRDGDYSQTVLDPSDGITFWNTSEYMGGASGANAAKTRIFSFQLPVCAAATPVANFTGTPTTICAGQSVTFTDASTNTPTSWAWTFTGGTPASSTVQNPVVVYNTPGTYSVTLTATNSSGSSTPFTRTGYITVNAVPATPTVTASSPVCTGGTITLSTPTVAGATYAWTGPAAFTSALQNPTRTGVTAAMAGTYSVTVTTGGCTSAAGTAAVVVNAAPAAPTAGSNSPVCAGSTINLTSTTVAGATYSWTGPSTFTSAVQNPSRPSATAAMAGTYSVTATVGGCTSAAATTAVVVNAVPATPTVTASSPVCAGATITLSTPTVAGATYAWTGPAAFTSAVQNPSRPSATAAMAGTYSVTVTTSGCTSAAGTGTVVVNPTPATPTAGSNSPVCAGSAINLTSTTVAGATYAWTGPSAFTSAVQNPSRPSATAAMAGTYSVTATAGGCTSAAATTTVVVNTAPATPTVTASSPVCTGTTITLSTPAVTGATYAWTGPAAFTSAVQNPTRPGASASMAGTYSVTVTVGGCTSAAGTGTVVVNPTPAAPAAGSNSPVCAGSVINLTATTVAGATYAWTGPSTFTSGVQNPSRPSATAAMAGTYSVTATVGGCTSAAATTAVVVNAVPATPAVTASSPVCAGATITLSTPAVTGATYAWTGPAAFTSAVRNPTRPSATAAMAGTYSVTVTTGGCTSAAGTGTVVVNPTPATPAAGSNSPVCTGSAINLTSTTVAGATYAWTGPSFTSAVQNPSLAGAVAGMAGTYSVTVTVGGCTSAAATTPVVVNAGPSAQAVTATNSGCSSSTGTITLGATTGGTSPYAYSVNGSGFTSTTAYTGFAAGSYPVVVQDANGCQFSTTANIGTSSGPTAQPISTVNSTCGNANGVLNIGATTGGAAPFTYSVNGSAYTGTTSYTGLAAGSYTVIVKDAGGCMFTTSATISNTPGPTAQAATTVNSTCGNANGSVNVGATTGGTAPYVYSFDGGAFTAATSYNGLAAGTYAVTVKDANGCTFTVNAMVSNTPGPTATVVTTANSTCGSADGSLTIGATTGGTALYTYSVNGGSSTSATSYTGLTAGTYTVVTTDANGCTFSTTATVGNTGSTPATPTITQAGSTLTSSSATGNQWYLNGSPIAGATGQNYTFITNGNYTVIVTTGSCSSASSAVTSITNVGIGEAANDPYGLSVYPNPNDGHFTVSFTSGDRDTYRVEIVNALGQLVYRDDVKEFTGTYKKEMSVVEYGQGVYTISLTNSKNETVKKIIVY